MSKIVLKNVDLNKVSEFVDKLTPLSESSTIYFNLSEDGFTTDSFNVAGTITKSIRTTLESICESSNIDKHPGKVKLSFFDGKKVKKAFSFLNGNEIKCEVNFKEFDGAQYATDMKLSSSKVSITLDCADPSLCEFANLSDEAIETVKDTSNAECTFRITSAEVLQIQKMNELDSEEEFSFKISDKVLVGKSDCYEIQLDENYEDNIDLIEYKIDTKLFSLVDATIYRVYPVDEDYKIVLKSEDGLTSITITLHEDVDEY